MRKEDPERKGYRTNNIYLLTCLRCQKPFKSPDKARVRICSKCKSNPQPYHYRARKSE